MAKAYAGFNNTPCAIIRGIAGNSGDGAVYGLRVGAVGCAVPTGWNAGTAENPVFFEKLKVAARRLTGASSDVGLSGVTIPAVFFLWQAGQAAWLSAVQGLFPNGALLLAPFFESISSALGPNALPTLTSFILTDVTFENAGGAAPTYADLRVTVSDDATQDTAQTITIKLFHSLTT